jgi:hypothetical protein
MGDGRDIRLDRTDVRQGRPNDLSSGAVYRPELLLQPSDVAAAVLNALVLAPTAEVTEMSIRSMQQSPPG